MRKVPKAKSTSPLVVLILALSYLAKAKLIAGTDRAAARKVDLQQLFGFDLPALFILARGYEFAAGDLDDLAARRIDQPPVDAAGEPAGLGAKPNAFLVSRRKGRRIEDVWVIVGPVGNPDFFLVMGERDAVADRAVAPRLSLGEAGRGNFVQNLAGL